MKSEKWEDRNGLTPFFCFSFFTFHFAQADFSCCQRAHTLERVVRIAVIIFHADPARGGAERYTIDLADGLRSRGHEVTLIASSFAGESGVLLPVGWGTRRRKYLRFLD